MGGQRHPRLWLVLVQGEHGIRDGLGQGGLLQRRKVQLQVPEDLRSLHRLALLCSISATSTLRTGKVAEDKAAAMRFHLRSHVCVTEAESMATAASRSPQYVRGGLHALYDFAHSTSTHEEEPELFLPEVREFIRDTKPRTNTTRGVGSPYTYEGREPSIPPKRVFLGLQSRS